MMLITVVVSTLIWATHATPTGNHTCTGVVKHPVTVRVNVTEPVTYRTYTWCLKVPPRCSKYTVQLQDRVKIHTEMHNRTITVCCKGYVEIDYKCVPACPPQTECPFMHCNRTNHCYCTPGYTGLYCNEPCERGFWGEHCLKECDCPTGYTCHHLTGDCMIDDRPSKIRRTTVSDVEASSKLSSTTSKLVVTTERTTTPSTTTSTTTPLTTTTTTTPSTTTRTTPSTTTTTPSTTTTTTTPSTTTTSTTPSTVATTIHTEATSPVVSVNTEPTISSTYKKPTSTSATTQASTSRVTSTQASSSESTSTQSRTTLPTSTQSRTTLPTTTQVRTTLPTTTQVGTTLPTTTQVGTTLATTEVRTTLATATQESTYQASSTQASTLPTIYLTSKTESISLPPTLTTTTEKLPTSSVTESSKSISSTELPTRTTEYTKPSIVHTEPQTVSTIPTTTASSTTERIAYTTKTDSPPSHTANFITNAQTEPITTTKIELLTESTKEATTSTSQSSSESSSRSMTTAAPSTSETTATSINLSTQPNPEIFTTLIEYSSTKGSTVKPVVWTMPETTMTTEKTWPKTSEAIPSMVETTRVTEDVQKAVTETKTAKEETFENMPPMMVNRKKQFSSEKETERTIIKEDVDLFQSTTSTSTTSLPTKADEGSHHFAPMVPFPHHTRSHKPTQASTTSSTSKTTQETTTTTTSTPITFETTQVTKSPLDFLQPFKSFDIPNGDNSITARPPILEDKITTEKSKESYIDNNKRLWEIFETGLNLKTTSSPIKTLPPIEITKTERTLKYGDVEKPIKKSDSMFPETTMTTIEEKETSSEISTFTKQLKHKEKYQKKVKPKVYDVTSPPQETVATYAPSTDYKIMKAKYPKSAKTETVDDIKTEKEATTESTTPYRPSHTWYSHAREKAKIKEAMKSMKTTLFDAVKPTEAFDNESNDINLMQTAFTEREDRNHKKGFIEANMINMTRPITRYVPQEITAGNEKDVTFYSNLMIIVGVSILMLLTLVTLFWIRANKIKRNESVSPASSIVAYSTQNETVSPLMYETVYPLNGGPELMEAATFFCPTFTNHYAERINRELSELSYDHPPSRRPLKFNQYTEVSLDSNKQ